MTKTILSAAVIATLAFSGCSQVSKTVDTVKDTAKSATEKVTSTVTGAVDSNKSAVEAKAAALPTTTKTDIPEAELKIGDVVETKIEPEVPSAALPTSSSMTDMATDKVVEVADAKTDGAASQVVDALK